jgi:hypothetical protein
MTPPFDPLAPRATVAIALVGLLGCSEPRVDPSSGASPSSTTSPPREATPSSESTTPSPMAAQRSERARADETAALVTWLREQTISAAEFHAPRVLYTWTRAEQIAELREEPVLLSRSEAASGERSAFDLALEGDAHPLARHLRQPAHRARRFAWANPWATRMGWPGADYGDRLIRVELRADAWIARFEPVGEPRWEVRDAAGAIVRDEDVRRQPWRVAAVYHERHDGPAGAFREYVLVSQRALSRFLVGHDAERLRADQAALERLARRLEGPAGGVDAWTAALPERWRLLRLDAELEALYAAGLAFGNELYRPEPARLRATAAALEIPVEPALVHVCPDEPPRRRSAQPPPAYPCYSTMGCP